MAKNMANKYLRLMPVFSRQGITNFQDILNSLPSEVSDSNLSKLTEEVNKIQKRYNISNKIREEFEKAIDDYFSTQQYPELQRDLKIAVLKIFFHRYYLPVL